MGYNISEVTGATGGGTGGLDTWTFDVALNGSAVTTVSGDFDEVPIGGGPGGEAAAGYDFSVTSGGAFGTLAADPTTGAFTFTIDRGAVFGSGSDQTVEIAVTGGDGENSDTDTVFINLTICIARGTLIETESGPVPVEQLRIGDRVRTVDGSAQPVRWVGCRNVPARELLADPALRPVRIAAGALGKNRPARELTVSPQHRILVGDWRAELFFGESQVLVPAKALVNGTTIRIDHDADGVAYFHVLFDRHEIMLTEGLPTESFHPGDYALRALESATRDELHKLFPELVDGAGAPETARMVLRPWESALLQPGRPMTGRMAT
ncbi:MAG: Hint domain-containing protein [Roseovarius sp.]|nr:Hint domain-containing protein [Roseovarius sp.]